jgi:serine phosphatase RsbU (regulator of sigma subunit)
VIGQLRKFAFMPVPDHRYLLEMGLLMEGFESQRSELSYVEIADRIQEMNPSIERIRIFDINQNLILEQGVTPDTGLHTTQLSDIFTTGRDSTIKDTTTHQVIRYLYIDLKESSTVSDMSLVAEITYTLVPFESALSQILLYYVLIGIIAVVMGIAMAFSIARFLSKPIGDIIEDVEQIARGDLAHTIRSMPNPEFRKLEESINLMIGRIETYSRQLERDKAEIQIAAEIQRTFLPRREPVLDNFEISARNIPAQEVGGDYYDFIQLDDRNLGIVIADVAGKGIPAALFMALSRSIIRAVATRDKSLDEIIRESNDLITADASAGMFVTLFYCVLDSRSGHLVYVNAGHNPPLHYRNGTGTLHTLLPSGMAMGVMPGNTYSVGELDLAPGDVLVLYTDGVTEAFNMPGEEFGEGRLMDTVIASHDLRAGEILGTIFSRVHDFIGEAAQSDDITVVVIRHMLRSLNEKDEKSGMVPLS